MFDVYAVVLKDGRWVVSPFRIDELKDRVTMGTCAHYDSKGRDLLECIAKFENTKDGLRK